MNKVKLILWMLLIFILLNAIIVLLWPLRTSLKFNNYKPYSDEFIYSLKLNQSEALKLYLETWQGERLFEYDEFTGLRESVSTDGKYVNIDIEKGRLVPNNDKNCKKNIFFYGGEIVFGYDVADNQSIPYYLREMFIEDKLDYCVFNFGRRTYYSTQENILFQKHLLKNKIKERDMIIFLDGNNEQGNQKLLNTDFIEKNYNALHNKYWILYKTGIKYFIDLLPVTQLIDVLYKKMGFNKKNVANFNDTNPKLKSIANVFDKNVKIRKAICDEYNFKCYNFLFFINNKEMSKYNELINTENVYDLTNPNTGKLLINKYESLSPESNQIIAKKIYERIIN